MITSARPDYEPSEATNTYYRRTTLPRRLPDHPLTACPPTLPICQTPLLSCSPHIRGASLPATTPNTPPKTTTSHFVTASAPSFSVALIQGATSRRELTRTRSSVFLLVEGGRPYSVTQSAVTLCCPHTLSAHASSLSIISRICISARTFNIY